MKKKIQVASKVYKGLIAGMNQGKTILSLQGSSRSGKTVNILIFLITYILEHNNTRLSIVRKTLPALKGSVLIDFKEILFKMDLWNDKVEECVTIRMSTMKERSLCGNGKQTDMQKQLL